MSGESESASRNPEEANIVLSSGAKNRRGQVRSHKAIDLPSLEIQRPQGCAGFKHFLDMDELRAATPDK
jgi:hypothetical protein